MDDGEFEEELEIVLAVSDEDAVLSVAEALFVIEAVEPVEPVTLEELLVELAVADPVRLPVAVPWALGMPKLGEKLISLGLVSSMISIVYWKLFTCEGSTVKVAVPSAAGTPPNGCE